MRARFVGQEIAGPLGFGGSGALTVVVRVVPVSHGRSARDFHRLDDDQFVAFDAGDERRGGHDLTEVLDDPPQELGPHPVAERFSGVVDPGQQHGRHDQHGVLGFGLV